MAATMLAAPRYGVEDFETMSIRSAAPSYSMFPSLAYASRGPLVSLAESGRGRPLSCPQPHPSKSTAPRNSNGNGILQIGNILLSGTVHS
jgi:hypothetical protein